MVKIMDKISVIVPVYNVEKFLSQCIESIINQTYRNIEIILVDDGSSDGCGRICDAYAEKDNRVRVIHKTNGGPSVARNVGIKAATGEYMAFVDSDDFIFPHMYEVLYKRIVKDKSDMVFCNIFYVDEDGKSITKRNQSLPVKEGVFSPQIILNDMVQPDFAPYTAAWNKLYKRKLFEDVLFPDGKLIEDAFIAHIIIDKCCTISGVREALYCYRQRSESIMNTRFHLKHLDGVEAFAERTQFALDKGLINLAVFSMRLMIAWMIKGVRESKQDADFKTRFEELKRMYDVLYVKIIRHKIGMKCLIQFTLFRVSVKLYNITAVLLERILHKSFYESI